MRTPAELKAIRSANRAALGMAGVSMQGIALSDSILSTALGAMGPATVSASFPEFSIQWDPSQPSVAPAPTSAWSDFLLRSIVRPKFQWGGVEFDYGSGYADFSNIARAFTWGAGLTAAGVAAWVLWRAFSGGRRSNPCRTVTTTTVKRSPFALARARRSA